MPCVSAVRSTDAEDGWPRVALGCCFAVNPTYGFAEASAFEFWTPSSGFLHPGERVLVSKRPAAGVRVHEVLDTPQRRGISRRRMRADFREVQVVVDRLGRHVGVEQASRQSGRELLVRLLDVPAPFTESILV